MIKDKKRYRILVIEDDEDDFFLIRHYLEKHIEEPQFTHAKNFFEARHYLINQKFTYDIILLDLTLPDINGEALIKELSSICSMCAIIVLTGYKDFQFSIKSLSMGVADYLSKDDINAASLYKSIIYSMERKKTSLALEEARNRYSNLFQLSPQPMWVYDPETFFFINVNKAAIEDYGYTKEEFLNMKVTELSAGKEIDWLNKAVSAGSASAKQTYNGRFRHYKKSKEIIEVDIYSNPIMISHKPHISVIAIDVTEKNRFEHSLTRAIIKTQEDERYEIGSELHDNVCQVLATSKMALGMLEQSLSDADMKWYERCREYIMLASDEIRNLSHRLAPAFFDDSTMEDTFKSLLATFNADNKYKISLQFDKIVKQAVLNREIQLNLYRILQEQLRNIFKYADGSEIEIEIKIINDNLRMTISDNGIGFDINNTKKGIGLANMRRRAELFSGKIEIDSSPGNGCTITIEIPVKEIDLLQS